MPKMGAFSRTKTRNMAPSPDLSQNNSGDHSDSVSPDGAGDDSDPLSQVVQLLKKHAATIYAKGSQKV